MPPLLLGHRGVRKNKSFTENTLAAFDFAIKQGCDGFEFDVRLAADGRAVIWHDAKIRRLEIARTPSRNLALPMLSAVLKHFRNNAFLDIELKVGGLEAITVDLLRAHPPKRSYVISSFLPEVLKVIHKKDPSIPLGLICETRSQFGRWSDLPVQYVIPKYTLVRKKNIGEIHASGGKMLVWTVNTKAAMQHFARLGVDGIISDYPAKLVTALRSASSS